MPLFFLCNYFGLLPQCLAHALFLQNLDLLELLAFDPASIGSTILEADDSPSGLTSTSDQLLRVKDLLSGPISALIQDSSAVKQILDEVNSQLPVSLQAKLLPAGYLSSFQAKVAEARHKIETRRSQSLLRTIIAEMCQSINKKKAALDAKTDTSASAQRLHLLEKELEDLEAKVRATKQRIQEEKDLIAGSRQEAEVLTAELKTDLAELSSLSKQVVPGVDEEDEAVLAEVDRIRLDAIAAIDAFLQQTCPR
jgi:predicted  nucleic acid-binding Zn-ribbon protein